MDGNGLFVARTNGQELYAGKAVSAVFRAKATGEAGSYYGRNVAGIESLVGYARSDLTGWTAAVNISSDAISAPLRRALILLLALGACLIVLAVCVAWVAGHRINRALMRLRDVARALGRGSSVEEIATPITEVIEVGSALREAARQLHERARDRDEAEAAVREREARLRLVVEGAKDHAILTTAPDGVVTSWSVGAAAIFGWTADAIVGLNASVLFIPEDRDADAEGLDRVLARRDGIAVDERWHVRRDGSRVFMNGTVHPLPPDTDGREQGFLRVARDETERRRADVALRELTATLEIQVAQRTTELRASNQRLLTQIDDLAKTQDALRQSQKMEAIGQLTGGIAHDFNNLLTGIVGSLELMLTRMRQGRTEALERYANAAMSSANRAEALTHRLLAFARRQPLEPKPTDANALIKGMEDLLRRTIKEGIDLEVVSVGGLWLTLCDPHQLENALLNLAINGRDAMPNGGRLTIETANAHLDHAYAKQHEDLSAGQFVCISVTDTGIGMSPDLAARAFEPFFTTKPMGQGTGLGLSMIYGFTKQSGGHAKIYSEVGRGTSVKLYLPRYSGVILSGQEATQAAPHQASGETVLVVEDEPVIRDLVVEVLGSMGYVTLEAADGPTGLAVLQSSRQVDLVITDIGLPGLDGRQMIDQARKNRPSLRALFVTGYAENAAFGNGCLGAGAEMVTKPFSMETLVEHVQRILRT